MLCGYIQQKSLGSGGFGDVFLVQDKGGEFKALKLTDEPLYIEADILSRILHPNILHCEKILFKSRDCNLNVGYVLPVALGSVRKLIHRFNLLKLMKDVSSAMSFLHSQSIIHCDLRMHNVLVFNDGFKIADFGISRYLETGNTISGGFSGPEQYLSPEAVANGSQSSSMIDVWMFGLLCLEYLVGDYWDHFFQEQPKELIRRNVPRELAKYMENGLLKDIVIACLDPDPYKRPRMSTISSLLSSQVPGSIRHFDRYVEVSHTKVRNLVDMLESEDDQIIFLAVNLLNKTGIGGVSMKKFVLSLFGQWEDISSKSREIAKITNGIINDDRLYTICKNKQQRDLTFNYILMSNPNIYSKVDLNKWESMISKY